MMFTGQSEPNAHMSVKYCNARAKQAITYKNHHKNIQEVHV